MPSIERRASGSRPDEPKDVSLWEMEAAAFFAVARFRGVRFAQLLYGGDDLSGDLWDPRAWTTSPSRARTFALAVELATRL